mgnify:CR=1 FL=1
MSQRLTDMSITRVSLVDKGANAKRFAVLKRDEEVAMTTPAAAPADETPAGIAAWLRKAADVLLGRTIPVAKTATFAEIVAGQELRDALYDSWYTLEDALWAAIYAYDENGQSLPLEAKKALVAQDLDEFKAYLLVQMDSGITKRDGGPAEAATRHVAAVIAKVGRKISAARLERLTSAADALNSVLAEVIADEDTEKRATGTEEVTDMATADEITAAVAKGLEPVIERIEAIEKRLPAEAAAAVAKTETTEDELTLEGVAKAVLDLGERVEAIAKARGERQSLAGQDGPDPVKKSTWAGIL